MLLKKVLFILVLISVRSFSQNYDSIHFENILKTTPAKELFLSRIIAKDKIIYQDEKNKKIEYTATEAFNKVKSTRYASQTDLTIENNNKLVNIGKGYGVDLYSDSEKVFTYGLLNFNRFALYSNKKNQVIACKLFNSNEKESNVKKFIDDYSKHYENEIVNDNGNEKYYFYLDDRTIKLIIRKNGISSAEVMSPYSEKPIENEIDIVLIVIYNDFTPEEQTYFFEKVDNY